MVALIGEERGDTCGGIWSVIVCELRERQEFGPIVLLIVTINPQVLLKRLVHPLGLSVSFRMIAGGEVEADVEGLTKGTEEMGNELGTPVGGDVRGNSVFGKHMEEEELGQLRRGDSVMGRYEDALFGQAVHDYQDGSEAGGGWKLLYEVHRYGVPRAIRDWELFEQAVRLVARYLGMGTGGAGGHIVLDESADTRPGIVTTDQF